MQFQNGPGDQGEKIRRFSRTDSPWIVRVFPGTGDAVSDRAGENPERYAVLKRGYP
jgi:hypothetical protein